MPSQRVRDRVLTFLSRFQEGRAQRGRAARVIWKPWKGFHTFPRCYASGEGEGEARGAGRA
jgi:hypothetical protein